MAITVSSARRYDDVDVDYQKPGAGCVEEFLYDYSNLVGKTLVVKLGGSTLENQQDVLQDLVWLQTRGVHPVLVHGGGPSIDTWLHLLHIPVHFERGLRVTDAQTLEVVCMVLRGQINEQLVVMLTKMGAKAVGLSGTDGSMVQAHIMDESLGLVGAIDAVDPTLLEEIINDGYMPVIAPLGLSADGQCLNINADSVAAHIADALHADQLIFLSNVTGICQPDGSLIPTMSEQGVHQLIEQGVIHGGMLPKVAACLDALNVVPSVRIIDGRQAHSLLRALCTHQPLGTTIVREDARS